MSTLLVAVLSFFGFIVAYHTYGRFLANKIFKLNQMATMPSKELHDGVDYVPTRRGVVFGHHFTSIAGTGPIVGPAIAVFWGWLPALLWVVLGSILVGAVHDLGSLVVSMRSRGMTIGDVAARMISHRARLLFLVTLFLALSLVLAVFGLVIATIFRQYPQTVLSAWISLPIAMVVGYLTYKRGVGLLVPSILALILVYAALWLGVNVEALQFSIPQRDLAEGQVDYLSPTIIWTAILFVYCFFASVMPVWLLLQPRDYVNSHQLIVALVLVAMGLLFSHPQWAAPAFNTDVPADAPPIMPFLFITIACGAISGFHCLVSSGTTSKQLQFETDAHYVGYGAMLLEGALAVVVIIACAAGLGMGWKDPSGATLTGRAAWDAFYGHNWNAMGLPKTVGAFVEGGANMLAVLPFMSRELAIGIVAVMVACFAATTLDTATRLQRYVIQELGGALKFAPLQNKYIATTAAVGVGLGVAMLKGPSGQPGTGGMILWPLFGAVNQLLAGLAFMVIAFYLIRHNRPIWFLVVPAALMIVLPFWAMWHQIIGWATADEPQWLLAGFGVLFEVLQIWMIVEGALMWRRAKGVLPAPLPPLRPLVAPAVSPGLEAGH